MRHNPSSRRSWLPPAQRTEEAHGFSTLPSCHLFLHPIALTRHPGQSGEIALMAEPVWKFRLSDGNEPLFSVPVRTQGCQTFPNAHPWASHPIALTRHPGDLDDDLVKVPHLFPATGSFRRIWLANAWS